MFGCVVTAEDCVKRRNGGDYDRQEFYSFGSSRFVPRLESTSVDIVYWNAYVVSTDCVRAYIMIRARPRILVALPKELRLRLLYLRSYILRVIQMLCPVRT